MLRYSILLFLLIISNLAIGQKNWYDNYIDSLINLSEQPGCKLVDSLYMEVGRFYAYANPVKSFDYLEKSLELSSKKKNFKVTCMSHSFLGIAYEHVGFYDKALHEFQNQMSVAQEHDVKDEIVWAYNNIGHIFLVIKNYELANNYLQKASEYVENGFEEIGHYVYTYLGRLMQETGQPDSALFYLNKTLKIRLKPPIEYTLLSNTYRAIGNVYYSENNFSKAKYFYGISSSLVDSTTSDMSAQINVNLAHIYMQEGLNDSAYICISSAISIAKRFHNRLALNQAYGVLGSILYNQGKTKEAEKYFSLQIAYKDSLNSQKLSKKIYNLQYQKEIHDMQNEIHLTKSNTRKVMILCVLLIFLVIDGVIFALRFRKKDKMIKSINLKIEEQNRQTNDSIRYAKKIQQAIIPNFDTVMPCFSDKFLLFKPKLKVSGNFYWSYSYDNLEMLAIGDSGEVGVPGALMSMLGSSILHEIVENDNDPSRILYVMRQRVLKVIQKVKPLTEIEQSLDLSLAIFNRNEKTIDFSGIKFPLIIIHDGGLYQMLDNQETNNFYTMDFTNITISLYDGDCIYMMTHGFSSQTNAKGEQYSRERLFKFLQEIHQLPMEEQNELLAQEIQEFRGNCEQKYDLLITGFRYQENTIESSTQEIKA